MDEKGKGAITTNPWAKVGEFGGVHGKEDCLVVCKIFGLTACEWNTFTGECYAYMKKFSVGDAYSNSYCYTFNDQRSKGKDS